MLGDAVTEFHGERPARPRRRREPGRGSPPSSRSSASASSPRRATSTAPASRSSEAPCSSTSASGPPTPDVFAVGDVASFHDPVFGHRRLIQHWTNANHHGERLGRSLAGETAPYDQVAYFFTEVFGTKLGLLGDLDGGHDELITRGTLEEGLIGYYLDGDRLVAALIIGQTPETQEELTRLLRNHARVREPGALRSRTRLWRSRSTRPADPAADRRSVRARAAAHPP